MKINGLSAMAVLGILASAHAQTVPEISDLQMQTGTADGKVGRRIGQPTGQVQLVVRMSDPPLAVYVGSNAKRLGFRVTGDQQRAYLQQLMQKQSALSAQIQGLGGVELGRVNKAHNALIIQIDAARVTAVSGLPGVALIRPVVDYQMSLSTTVPYIGAAAVQAAGLDGTGITVAVLDSGIDYTHRNLGGPGTGASYTAAYGTSAGDSRNKTRDGLFPTAKVVEGFDFVGEVWPNGPLAPDPDPIDINGHGTHVADIIAGFSAVPLHKGVAPGAKLLAVKVCSAVTSGCSGVALLEGMDYALDPNNDGDISDAADVISMSLGSNYGQREDDLSEAATIASALGVVVVAASGNAGDRPYITSSPAVTPAVISVAETQVPTAVIYPLVINSPAAIAGTYTNTATVDWAPVTGVTIGNVAFVGRGCPAGSIDGSNPDDAYLASPAGKVALIDRGSCSISLKVDRAAQAGATGVLIGLIAAGDAVSFSFGGGTVFVPTLVITQSNANAIKANIGAPVNVTISATNAIPLVGSMVASSARGPGYSYNSIKPDIGAPGASVSAIAGAGTGESAFGGTSGATPMISGSVALLLQAYPTETVQEIKARLIETAETGTLINPATQPGVLAPITQIAGGEVRVDRARNTNTVAWDAGDPASVTLSFATYRATGVTNFKKKVQVRNYSAAARSYTITPSFRYANDAANGAVSLSASPSTLSVPANSSGTFTLTMTLDASLLTSWTLNGGNQGGNGPLLQTQEFDGYLTIAGGGDTIHLPWQILPHKSANVTPATSSISLGGAASTPLSLTNLGGNIAGRLDVFSLTGTSPKLPAATLPRPGDNYAVIDLKSVGVRLASSGGNLAVQFAINTWGERSHPNYPAEFDVAIDVNNDGIDDFVIYNSENGGFGVTGQNVVSVANLATNTVVTRFFADADLNSSDIILTALLSDMGLSASVPFRFSVYAFDNYFSGALTDSIVNAVYRLDAPRFFATGVPASIAANGSGTLTVNNLGNAAVSPSQTGLLLLYRDAKSGREADTVTIIP